MCLCVRACGYLEVEVANTEHWSRGDAASRQKLQLLPLPPPLLQLLPPLTATVETLEGLSTLGWRRYRRVNIHGWRARAACTTNVVSRGSDPFSDPPARRQSLGRKSFFRRSAVAPPTVMATPTSYRTSTEVRHNHCGLMGNDVCRGGWRIWQREAGKSVPGVS